PWPRTKRAEQRRPSWERLQPRALAAEQGMKGMGNDGSTRPAAQPDSKQRGQERFFSQPRDRPWFPVPDKRPRDPKGPSSKARGQRPADKGLSSRAQRGICFAPPADPSLRSG